MIYKNIVLLILFIFTFIVLSGSLNWGNFITIMRKYKTTNEGHQGHLYTHSVWVAKSIEKWFNEDNFWVYGIDKLKYKRTMVLAGFLHDIGKMADSNKLYSQKPSHPYFGLLMLLNLNNAELFNEVKKSYLEFSQVDKNEISQQKIKHYLLDGKKFNFDKFFKQLGVTQEQRLIITILCAIHWDFGELCFQIKNNTHKKEHFFNLFLNKLKTLVKVTNYNCGNINEDILRMSILIGAADIYGASEVNYNSRLFPELNKFDLEKNYNFSNILPFKKYNLNTFCLKIKDQLIHYYKSHK